MTIYPDKKAGQLTGFFRVEVTRGAKRVRKRCATLLEAQQYESDLLAAWDAGEALAPVKPPETAPVGMTLSKAVERGEGLLWYGLPSADCNWAHVRFAMEVFGPQTSLEDIGEEQVEELVRRIVKKGVADGTLNRYLSHLKVFLEWTVSKKFRSTPVDIAWPWRKETKGRLRWLSYPEETMLLSLVPENTGKLIRVAIATGCRRDELVTAQANQVEVVRDDEGQIVEGLLHLWKTKNDEARTVPMDAATTALMLELTTGTNMPTRRTLRRHWDKAKDTMGLSTDDEFVFHACRHTCATRMVAAGIDVLVIKAWLGHKRIETTQRYAHVQGSNLRSALTLVGQMKALAMQEPQKTACPTVPHQLPHGGANEEISIAA